VQIIDASAAQQRAVQRPAIADPIEVAPEFLEIQCRARPHGSIVA
jgi:hypothetical protein